MKSDFQTKINYFSTCAWLCTKYHLFLTCFCRKRKGARGSHAYSQHVRRCRNAWSKRLGFYKVSLYNESLQR